MHTNQGGLCCQLRTGAPVPANAMPRSARYLGEQDAERRTAELGSQLAALGEQLQYERAGRQRQRDTDDDCLVDRPDGGQVVRHLENLPGNDAQASADVIAHNDSAMELHISVSTACTTVLHHQTEEARRH